MVRHVLAVGTPFSPSHRLWTELPKWGLGWDEWMEGVGTALLNSSRSDTHPPYNVVKGENGHTTVEVAVAGYDPERIRVVVSGKTLTVSCAAETDTREYTVRGMTRRPWVKHWTLGEWTRVVGARLCNGVLELELRTETPGTPEPQEIPVVRS